MSRIAPVDVAILCVTYRSGDVLADFAAALPAGAESVTSRVVIVDGGSPDDTPDVVRTLLPAADLVPLETNRGFAAAINAGVDHIRRTGGARGVLIVNPDVRLGPGCLAALLTVLADPAVGIAVPRLIDEHGAMQWSLRRPPTVAAAWAEALLGGPAAARLGLPGELVRTPAAYEQVTDAAWATGGMLLVSMDALDRVGPWREWYFMYEEEVDYCLRVRDAGLALRYTPDAQATRVVGAAGDAPWATALMSINRVAHVRTRPGGWWRAPLIRAALIVGNGIRWLRGRRDVGPALWALVRRSRGPQAVMDRFRPDAKADVRGSANKADVRGSANKADVREND
jgi:N-acetylglucosaminyl-diphospho-decaprenol L-rhamnosyltransferase